MKRYFIYLSYNGKKYCGWQVQPNGITVQQQLEMGISILLKEKIDVVGAGRTDAGVHARLMVAHFDCPEELIDCAAFCGRLNRLLPPDIAIHKIVPVNPNAHARFDALSRTYHYYLTGKKDPFCREFLYKSSNLPDFEAMNAAAQVLFEYEDFTSFSKLHSDVKTNLCTIYRAEWVPDGENWVFVIQADRFLRNMVRAIVGTLLEVGRGKLSIEEFREIIENKDRKKAGSSAPAHALFLIDVEYPDSVFEC